MHARLVYFLFSLFSVVAFAAPSIRISKPIALVDQEISIEVRGLRPFQHVVLHAQTTDADQKSWSSEAVFCSDDRGRVRLTKTAPLDGSYCSVDGMGLFWSMQPDTGYATSFKMPNEMIINLDLIINGQPILSREIKRLKKSPAVRSFSVTDKGVVGKLFLPPSSQPHPVIVVLGGAHGGISEEKAQLLSSHGYAVFALAYFGVEGLPEKLENIPMEYFAKAFQWIEAQPDLDDKRIGLLGISRGAELALLLGTHFVDKVRAIAAVAPSSVTFGALENTTAPAWLLDGKPINPYPVLSKPDLPPAVGKDPKHPLEVTPFIVKAMEQNPSFEQAAIPVEKIRCPLLLISGEDDKIWPALLFASQIKQRLEEKKSKISVRHYNYSNAGHQIDIPYLPTASLYYHPSTKLWLSTGGAPQDNARASRDSWEKILVFFQNRISISK